MRVIGGWAPVGRGQKESVQKASSHVASLLFYWWCVSDSSCYDVECVLGRCWAKTGREVVASTDCTDVTSGCNVWELRVKSFRVSFVFLVSTLSIVTRFVIKAKRMRSQLHNFKIGLLWCIASFTFCDSTRSSMKSGGVQIWPAALPHCEELVEVIRVLVKDVPWATSLSHCSRHDLLGGDHCADPRPAGVITLHLPMDPRVLWYDTWRAGGCC